jgi:hypothetical protein
MTKGKQQNEAGTRRGISTMREDRRARADVPADTYTFFMDILMDTVRSEIAECRLLRFL